MGHPYLKNPTQQHHLAHGIEEYFKRCYTYYKNKKPYPHLDMAKRSIEIQLFFHPADPNYSKT